MQSQSTIGGVTACPLSWPANRKRTPVHARQHSSFEVPSFAVARDELLHEVKRIGGRSPVLSTNVALRNDGIPYANQRQPDDTGVAVYFVDRKGVRKCFACDRWKKIEDNMRAIQKTIDAIRGIQRWGSGEDMEAAFSGFTALPLLAMRCGLLTGVVTEVRDKIRIQKPKAKDVLGKYLAEAEQLWHGHLRLVADHPKPELGPYELKNDFYGKTDEEIQAITDRIAFLTRRKEGGRDGKS